MRTYGSCERYLYEIEDAETAKQCGMKSGFLNGIGICLPIVVYSYSSLGKFKTFALCALILAVTSFYGYKEYGEKWDHTQEVKKYYKSRYNDRKCEKLLILREKGYGAKSN